MYSEEPRLRLYTYLYAILTDENNDRGLSFLTSMYYKPQIEFTEKGLRHAREKVMDTMLDALAEGRPYILE